MFSIVLYNLSSKYCTALKLFGSYWSKICYNHIC